MSPKRKRWLALGCVFLLLFCTCAVPILLRIHTRRLLSRSIDAQPLPGHIVYAPDGADNFPLYGLWEFYPDVLLGSEGLPEDTEPLYVPVPCSWASLPAGQRPQNGRGSYRLILDDFPTETGSRYLISLGTLLADYNVYIHGIPSEFLPAPYSYNLATIYDASPLEIFIEVENPLGLTAVPTIGTVDTFMPQTDSLRNVVLCYGAILLITFAMFLLFSFMPDSRRLRPFFLLGLLFTVLVMVNAIWALGYLDVFRKLLLGRWHAAFLYSIEVLIVFYALAMFSHMYKAIYPRRHTAASALALGLSWVVYILGVCAIHRPALIFLSNAFFVLGVLIWLYRFLCALAHDQLQAFQMGGILLLMFIVILLNMVYWQNGIWSWMIYAIPGYGILLLLFSFLYYGQQHQLQLKRVQDALELEKSASRTQAALLASQIQPHFLYNTLLTIQSLCKTDPNSASNLIVRFSDYLRHNIDFMNYTDLIPFSAEEKHIENFIYIQQARFGDKLDYIADIQYRNFQIPPLTVQPIIENAVKYGVRNSLDGGTVELQVRKGEYGVMITVRNTGPGFDPNKVTMRSLRNIRERLETLLSATLTIRNGTEPYGCEAEIFIPASEIEKAGGYYENSDP